jgi:membrane protein YqaA with SNARE-associated domain
MQQQNATDLFEFVNAAKAKGASDEFLSTLLARRGFPADDVYAALGRYWEGATGVAVPARDGSGESSRDAFLYLLSFGTLGTWATALGSMIFHFINRWFPDPLARNSLYEMRESVSWPMASIFVAFPIYMLVMRFVLRDAKEPERLQSGVRKWLTYIALFITATTMICDLIVFLNGFLTGELTSRFVLKAATVMSICGAIFAWYLGFLRWSAVSPVSRRSRNRAFAMTATAAVAITFCGGFLFIGSPSQQRRGAADERRVADLRSIARAVNSWHDRAAKDQSIPALPSTLRELSARGLIAKLPSDPETSQSYRYQPQGDTRYELCARFTAMTSRTGPGRVSDSSDFWRHGEGETCFVLAAGEPVPW